MSEAYFARMLGLPFIAVMPRSTSQEKIDLIEFHGGKCHLVDGPSRIYDESRRLAAETDGHYMDQFTYAERATDWRGNNNIAESIFEQLAHERHPGPGLDRGRRRHGWHVRDDRPLRPLPAPRHPAAASWTRRTPRSSRGTAPATTR